MQRDLAGSGGGFGKVSQSTGCPTRQPSVVELTLCASVTKNVGPEIEELNTCQAGIGNVRKWGFGDKMQELLDYKMKR